MLSSSVRSSSSSAACSSRSFSRTSYCSPSSFASTSRHQLPVCAGVRSLSGSASAGVSTDGQPRFEPRRRKPVASGPPSIDARTITREDALPLAVIRTRPVAPLAKFQPRRQLSRTVTLSEAEPASSPTPGQSFEALAQEDPDAFYLDGITGRPPPLVQTATDPTQSFILARIAQLEQELAAPEPVPASPLASGTTVYTEKQAASSLSELRDRLDALVESSGGDLNEAQERLERLAFELGRERDVTTNVGPDGRRKPSYSPAQELSRSQVEDIMDSWELLFERAVITALHPRSLRLEPSSIAYLTHLHPDGGYVLNPRRVAQIVTRTLMRLVIAKTAVAADISKGVFEARSQDESSRAVKRQHMLESNLHNYYRVNEAGEAGKPDSRRDEVRDERTGEFLTPEERKSAEAHFDILTREAVEELSSQLQQEYEYVIGQAENEPNPNVPARKAQKADESPQQPNNPCTWTEVDRFKLGSDLLGIALDVWNLRPVASPGTRAFIGPMSEYSPEKNHAHSKRAYVIRPHFALVKTLRDVTPDVRFLARDLPMISPPRLWPTAKNGLDRSERGGYLTRETEIVKRMSRRERGEPIERAMAAGEMDDLLEAVNTISTNPWRVNSPILEVILQAVHPPDPTVPRDPDQQSKLDQIAGHVRAHHLLPLNIARAYEGRCFYLPHNLDYRGRIYSVSPYLHPPGDDFSRGLLLFGSPKPLGPDGLYWLKVHLSGVYGEDKKSFDGRVGWVDSHLEQIRNSARDPINEPFWLQGDKPFQILAACFEIDRALRSEDVEAFESSLPVHMDGTCNGMQYYAALGRDLKGGRSVNLSPAAEPQDVYGEVLTVVTEAINDSDKTKWDELKRHQKVLLGRKTVKTTVMTSVYGVTNVGAHAQVLAALEESNRKLGPDKLRKEQLIKLSEHLADEILLSINKLFPVATSIQNWLGSCLDLIVNSRPQPKGGKKKSTLPQDSTTETTESMSWTTPLGLPVVQAYREIKTKQIKTKLQAFSVIDRAAPTPVEPFREHNGFAPNFIHSLDASHLFMTVNECTRKGVTFGSVHDSFWTHAATVPELNASLRDAFVRLHSSEPNLLDRLRNQLVANFGEHSISAEEVIKAKEKWGKRLAERREAGVQDDPHDPWVQWPQDAHDLSGWQRIADVLPFSPQRGQLDINDVKKSLYFFK